MTEIVDEEEGTEDYGTPDRHTELPDKLSALIRVALDDLEKCEQDPRYTIEMCDWHEAAHTTGEGANATYRPCSVCLAGAVMAQTAGVPVDEEAEPCEWDKTGHDKFIALNNIRAGWTREALAAMYENVSVTDKLPSTLQNKYMVAHYDDNPEGMKEQLRAIADDLEHAGW